MCLVLLAWQIIPHTPLVLAANRDEVRTRATRRAHFWPDQPHVLAGRDLLRGGTWLGITREGRFAALTNYRDPAHTREDTSSRGALVADFLRQPIPAEEFVHHLRARREQSNGYNLLFGDRHALWYYSNIEDAPRQLPPGVYGLSNHLLDTPWPKVLRAKSALPQALAALPDHAPLFELLRDEELAADQDLPRTGVSLEWERLLSAAFIRGSSYATVSSTVIVISDQHTRLEEITFDDQGAEQARLQVQLAANG